MVPFKIDCRLGKDKRESDGNEQEHQWLQRQKIKRWAEKLCWLPKGTYGHGWHMFFRPWFSMSFQSNG
jgi:hypothetical protein